MVKEWLAIVEVSSRYAPPKSILAPLDERKKFWGLPGGPHPTPHVGGEKDEQSERKGKGGDRSRAFGFKPKETNADA